MSRTGVSIVYRAMKEPLKCIADNSGLEGKCNRGNVP